MKNRLIQSILVIIGVYIIGLCIGATAFGDDTAARPQKHSPPPQAYEDCKGKKVGDTVLHTTPEGKVEATCADSPDGLVARPKQHPSAGTKDSPPQNIQPKDADSEKSEQ